MFNIQLTYINTYRFNLIRRKYWFKYRRVCNGSGESRRGSCPVTDLRADGFSMLKGETGVSKEICV